MMGQTFPKYEMGMRKKGSATWRLKFLTLAAVSKLLNQGKIAVKSGGWVQTGPKQFRSMNDRDLREMIDAAGK